MKSFIKIAFISLSINMFYAQTTLAQSKVFNNVYNDYYYTENFSGNTYYNSEVLYSINEFETNSYTVYGRGKNHIGGNSIYAYQYILNIDDWGDTLLTKRLNLKAESDLEASYSGILINNTEYIIGITNDINLPYFENINAKILKLDSNRDTIWTREYNMGDDNKFATIKTNDNGATFQVLGFADIDTAGINYDAFISTIDSNGNLISNIQLGDSLDDFLYALEYLDNGNYLLCGHTFSYGVEGSDIWLSEVEPNGTVAWQKFYGGQYYERIWNSKGMLLLNDFIYLAGTGIDSFTLNGVTQPSGAGWLLKLDLSGNVLWEKKFLKGSSPDYFLGIKEFDNNSFILGGQSYFYSDSIEYPIGWIVKVDTNGNTIWDRTVQKYTPADNAGDEPHHYVSDMLVSSDKGILLGGYIIANYIVDDFGFFHRNDAWLVKTDSCGFTVGDIPTPFFVVDSIQNTKESSTVFITEQSQDYCTATIDWGDGAELEYYYAYENNLPLAEKQLQHTFTENGTFTIKTTTLAGEEFRTYEVDIVINGISVGVEDVTAEEVNISLFPNPSNDYIIVENPNTGKIPNQVGHDVGFENSELKMSIYDLNGKLMTSILLNSKLYQQKINVSNLNNGVYFVSFEMNDELIDTKKMVIAR